VGTRQSCQWTSQDVWLSSVEYDCTAVDTGCLGGNNDSWSGDGFKTETLPTSPQILSTKYGASSTLLCTLLQTHVTVTSMLLMLDSGVLFLHFELILSVVVYAAPKSVTRWSTSWCTLTGTGDERPSRLRNHAAFAVFGCYICRTDCIMNTSTAVPSIFGWGSKFRCR
jgi:hypothetical protein